MVNIVGNGNLSSSLNYTISWVANGASGSSGTSGSSGSSGTSGSSGSSGTSGTSVAVSGTGNVFTKFTGTTTIGNTDYDVHENPSDGTLSFGPATDTDAITYGQIAHAKDNLSVQGDAQTNQIILKAIVGAGGASAVLTSDSGGGAQIQIPVGTALAGVISFRVQLVAMENSANSYVSHLVYEGIAKVTAGSSTLVSGPVGTNPVEENPGLHDLIFSTTGSGASGAYLVIEAVNKSGTGGPFGGPPGRPAKFVAYVRYTQTIF